MPLVPAAKLLQHAQENRYAVPGFNFHNMVDLQAIISAAESEEAPVILMATEDTINFVGFDYVQGLAAAAAKGASVPFALHLDHGRNPDNLVKGIRYGFTSVMFDGSRLAFDENIRLTGWVADVAHRAGVSVEAELGQIPGHEDNVSVSEQEAGLTDPATVAEFVEKTGVDSLAVAIGTAHGLYKREPKLDFDRLEAIRKEASVPLVLHGGTGVPDEAVKKAISLGICKLNVGTDLRLAYMGSLRQTLEDPGVHDPRVLLRIAREAVMDVVRGKIRLCGASHKAGMI
ncbi:MAG: class II fructose-bisphosphate aldolase [Firmicutes bacterium]|jgi:fructose-bisphosphate aldolase class II|nr:class II fructose-bisphosphate aldolase [Bacillota bacterium]